MIAVFGEGNGFGDSEIDEMMLKESEMCEYKISHSAVHHTKRELEKGKQCNGVRLSSTDALQIIFHSKWNFLRLTYLLCVAGGAGWQRHSAYKGISTGCITMLIVHLDDFAINCHMECLSNIIEQKIH